MRLRHAGGQQPDVQPEIEQQHRRRARPDRGDLKRGQRGDQHGVQRDARGDVRRRALAAEAHADVVGQRRGDDIADQHRRREREMPDDADAGACRADQIGRQQRGEAGHQRLHRGGQADHREPLGEVGPRIQQQPRRLARLDETKREQVEKGFERQGVHRLRPFG
jgi:hypothetical protein